MQPLGWILMLLGQIYLASGSPAASLWPIVSAPTPYANIQNATSFALVYGYPLGRFTDFVAPFLSSVGANALYNEKGLATASEAAVVRPNVDTIYSGVAVDLSHVDLAVTIPPVGDDRFYIFPFYDIYGDNFANIGSVTNSTPGTYLMRTVDAAHAQPGLQLISDGACQGERAKYGSRYLGFINFPTTYGSLLIRILLRNNSTDVAVVQRIQSQIQFSPVNRTDAKAQAPSLSLDLLNGSLSGSPDEQILQRTARIYPHNRPELRDNVANVTAILKLAGLRNGIYCQPKSVNLTAAAIDARLGLMEDLYDASNRQDLGNNWTQFVPSLSGNFPTDFFARAYIAFSAYLQLVSSEALYPEYIGESATASLMLKSGKAAIFTFTAKPPVTGFWSLTAYGSNQYLIPNPLNVYSLGDRSHLTYPDGSLVYGNSSSNAPFQILVQPADETPPANWTGNWLPAPASGGNFSVNLRFYGPTPAFTNGAYLYPVVTKSSALTA